MIPLDSPNLPVAEPISSSGSVCGRDCWGEMFDAAEMTGRPGLRFLEIGCFQGGATRWLLENVLTDPSSTIDVIDAFEGSLELSAMADDGAALGGFAETDPSYPDQVAVLQGTSGSVLRALPVVETYDFIYVDGAHAAPEALTAAVLAWPLLKPGGVMAFDDCLWMHRGSEHKRRGRGIDAFRRAFEAEIAPVFRDSQLAVAKL